ncbi:MAG: Tetratricopeptide repeat protein [uncultured bacterium]|nr:MAG: Tetratricopeptide repeat protein [uncultured bacterium]OFW81733.1 MAG: hypothetical protein A3E50_07080 [Alphaproteobacteria bacterium RIFCSPHIGHO2_12_FULL_42_100]OFW85480.1 MAG: hypothetical protein A2W06_04760 [Alphaproteobacteria bacterium RBG_16_42_14]OFW90725.1 MAG: hypothetical protein A3C41_05470 [Alphaproteobacteria bacterium RIFCSPHIGHO2_02_FULL_42_30]OFW92718.1 MAG: hypothetical protein A2W46_01210 [Alphaproteobacteria bacterium RIFCSPHIGHO2_12_42_13]OFX04437.1 MAG: hypotheti
MRGNDFLFPQDIYLKHLNIIRGIHFTPREIEVMACILHKRGTSKIASFLSIAPNTVFVHTRNITAKLGCNSREGIIDFIEKSNKLSFLRNYYARLVIEAEFGKTLKAISKLKRKENLGDTLIYCENNRLKIAFIQHLVNHLKHAGIHAEIREQAEDHTLDVSKRPENILLLLIKKGEFQEIPSELSSFNFIDLTEQNSYYLSAFEVLRKLLPDVNFESPIANFIQLYEGVLGFSEEKYVKIDEEEFKKDKWWQVYNLLRIFKNKKGYFVLAAFFVGMLLLGLILFKGNEEMRIIQISEKQIRSDLFIPTESTLLHRLEKLAQIDEKLNRGLDIQTIAIIGPGGAGKTILARQYARKQKASVIWEMNAETYENLKSSFENLSYSLAKTEEDQKILRGVQEIKSPKEKTEKLIGFVKERLKAHPCWFLIYDNVEKFTDIQNFLPYDAETWGKGKIILTTRDSNIQNNDHLNDAVQIGELSVDQKLTLFRKIMTSGSSLPFITNQTEDEKSFLNKIPPYPLDISVAAYYVKTANVSYAVYLENLAQNNMDFASIQEGLLRDAGNYTKTRYALVTLSIERLINTHKNFGDILLFISLLDSQNIPRGLLDTYKNNTVVDNFIYHLKKYSFITNESFFRPLGQTISLHRSTQSIALNYLTKLLDLKKDTKIIQSISNTLDTYIIKAIRHENLPAMKLLLHHCETFLTHPHVLDNTMKGSIGTDLGSIYLALGDYTKAKLSLEESLLYLKKDGNKNYSKLAQNLVCLGNVHREMGQLEKAMQFIEQGLDIYKNYLPENHTDVALASAHLGNIYRSAGLYKKAAALLERSLEIYNKYPPDNPTDIALDLVYLGIVNIELGNYEKAKEDFEQSLIIYQRHFPKTHVKVGWALGCLGRVYMELADYEKAKSLLEQALIAYTKSFPDNHDKVAWVLSHLGNVYVGLENYKKARELLEQALETYKKTFTTDHPKIAWISLDLGHVYMKLGDYQKAKSLFDHTMVVYKKYFSEDHIEMAYVLRNIGQLFLLEGNLEKAEKVMNQTLKIYQKNKHPDIYASLEILAELYVEKSTRALKEKNISQSQHFKSQAISFLEQALKKVEIHFSADSPHIQRIQSKIKILEQKD